MTPDHLAKSEYNLPNIIFGGLGSHTIESHESELTRIRLREALAREHALRHEKDELARQLFALQNTAADRVAGLTPRERQVMDLVLAGHPSKNIATDLGVSQRTVENHRAAIMKKTGTKCLPALARLAVAAAWTDAPAPWSSSDLHNTGEPDHEPNCLRLANPHRGQASR